MDGETEDAAGCPTRRSLAKIPPALQAVIDAQAISGFVTLIWRKGEELQFNALGKRDIASGAPMTRDTLFRIASMTKPSSHTTRRRSMLMEEGKLETRRSRSQQWCRNSRA